MLWLIRKLFCHITWKKIMIKGPDCVNKSISQQTLIHFPLQTFLMQCFLISDYRYSHESISAFAGNDSGHPQCSDPGRGAGHHPARVCGYPGAVSSGRQWGALAQPGETALCAHAGVSCTLWPGNWAHVCLLGLMGNRVWISDYKSVTNCWINHSCIIYSYFICCEILLMMTLMFGPADGVCTFNCQP